MRLRLTNRGGGTMKKRLIIGLLLILTWPGAGWAAVAYDAVASGRCGGASTGFSACGGGGTSLTYSHTVGAGSNRQIVVFAWIVCAISGTAPTATATYNGTSLTQIQTLNPASQRRGYMWAWPTGGSPTSGANNVVITMSADFSGCGTPAQSTLQAGSISFTGVDSSTTFRSSNTNSGSGTSATLTISSSNANDMGVHSACAGTDIGSTTETERWQSDLDHNSCGSAGGATATGGDTGFSWSISSDSWMMIGGALQEAGGGGGGATPRNLLLLGVGP